MEVQPIRQVLLKIRMDEFNGALKLIVGQGHFISGGNYYFTHMGYPFFLIYFCRDSAQQGKTVLQPAQCLIPPQNA